MKLIRFLFLKSEMYDVSYIIIEQQNRRNGSNRIYFRSRKRINLPMNTAMPQYIAYLAESITNGNRYRRF